MLRAVTAAYWLAGLLHKLDWTQGGLNDAAVAASAKVHDGLCVADLRTTNMTNAEVWRVATWLLRCGVIANIRGVVDSLVEHFHCVMANPKHAHKDAARQVEEYRDGGDGLVGDKPFYGPKVPFTTWENSRYYGTDELDMAEPKDVWKVDTDPDGTETAGQMLNWIRADTKNVRAETRNIDGKLASFEAGVDAGINILRSEAVSQTKSVLTAVTAVVKTLGALSSELGALTSEVGALRDEVTALRTDQARIGSRLDAIETTLNEVRA